jgi:hypothetical protein
MAITELALLRLSPGVSSKDPSLLANLATAKKTMEDFTSLPFHCYSCVEDPSLVYIIGGWPNIEQHMESWISSPENQALLQLMKDQVQVEWMFHVNADPSTLPFDKPVLAIAQHFVGKDEKGVFEGTFNGAKHHLELYIGGEGHVRGGWRIDKDEEKSGDEEWVLFTAWGGMREHMDFAETEGFNGYIRIKDFMKSSAISHATRLEVG